MKKILLLSDTHSFIDNQILRYVNQADEIWHAGDIGSYSVIDSIRAIKPLRAVYGNIDDIKIRSEFPIDNKFVIEKTNVFITHIGGSPKNYNKRIIPFLKQNPPNIFICGHSHILRIQYDKKNKLLYLNPGAVGKYGFHKIRTMIRFTLNQGKIRDMEIIELSKK